MKKYILPLGIILNLSAVFGIWFYGSGFLFGQGLPNILIAFGRLFGLLGEFLILLQLSLIGRIKIIEQQYGFDNLNRIHRFVGKCTVFVFILHPIMLSIGYGLLMHISPIAQSLKFLSDWEDVWKAVIGLIIFVGVIFISVNIIRKKLRYETWYFTHLLLYVAIALAFGHQINTGDVSSGTALYYWLILNFFIFGMVLVYRFLRPLFLMYRHRFRVERIVHESSNVCSVYISGKNLERFSFEAGNYANLIFIRKGLWFSHPFSFSKNYNGREIRFTIKGSGDFTSRVDTITPGTPVLLDGPLGVFTEKKSTRNSYLLIAGGIGITPLRSLAESLSKKGKQVSLMYAVQREADLVFRSELEAMSISRHYIFSEEKKTGFDFGRVNLDYIKKNVPDFETRDIYICGPWPMIRSLSDQLSAVGIPKNQIHFERFAY